MFSQKCDNLSSFNATDLKIFEKNADFQNIIIHLRLSCALRLGQSGFFLHEELSV